MRRFLFFCGVMAFVGMAEAANVQLRAFEIASPEGQSIIASSSVRCVHPFLTEQGKRAFNIFFDEVGKAHFAAYTAQNLDKKIHVLVNGEIVLKPVVRSAITRGEIILTAETLEQGLEFNKAFAAFPKCKANGENDQ